MSLNFSGLNFNTVVNRASWHCTLVFCVGRFIERNLCKTTVNIKITKIGFYSNVYIFLIRKKSLIEHLKSISDNLF